MRLLIALLFAGSAFAQGQSQQHSVTLNWVDTSNPAGTLYNIYRATGLCSGTPAFSKLANGVTAKTYLDTTIVPGNYCFYVTATSAGIESAPSNSALAPVPSFAPTALNVVVQ